MLDRFSYNLQQVFPPERFREKTRCTPSHRFVAIRLSSLRGDEYDRHMIIGSDQFVLKFQAVESRAQLWISETPMLFRFRICGLGNEESFEDTPNTLTENSSNENAGIENQGTALHANYFDFRFFSRLVRRIFLYSCMSSFSDAPHSAIIASSSLAAARIASTSALRLCFCAGMKNPSVSP
jgi:hypothetical protein